MESIQMCVYWNVNAWRLLALVWDVYQDAQHNSIHMEWIRKNKNEGDNKYHYLYF